MRLNVGPALVLGPPPNNRALREIEIAVPNKGPQPPAVLRSLWIDLKERVENLSCVSRARTSEHIKADLTSLPLILNKPAPRYIIGDLRAKASPTLRT